MASRKNDDDDADDVDDGFAVVENVVVDVVNDMF